MSSTVVAKFIRKSKKDVAPTSTPQSSRVSAPNRLELFTPRYSDNNYGPAGRRANEADEGQGLRAIPHISK